MLLFEEIKSFNYKAETQIRLLIISANNARSSVAAK